MRVLFRVNPHGCTQTFHSTLQLNRFASTSGSTDRASGRPLWRALAASCASSCCEPRPGDRPEPRGPGAHRARAAPCTSFWGWCGDHDSKHNVLGSLTYPDMQDRARRQAYGRAPPRRVWTAAASRPPWALPPRRRGPVRQGKTCRGQLPRRAPLRSSACPTGGGGSGARRAASLARRASARWRPQQGESLGS